MVWHATSECTPDMSPHDCKFTLKVPDPPGGETCTHNSTTNGCSRQGSHTAWFTNFTSVPEVTLQASIYQMQSYFHGIPSFSLPCRVKRLFRSMSNQQQTSMWSFSAMGISKFKVEFFENTSVHIFWSGNPSLHVLVQLIGKQNHTGLQSIVVFFG